MSRNNGELHDCFERILAVDDEPMMLGGHLSGSILVDDDETCGMDTPLRFVGKILFALLVAGMLLGVTAWLIGGTNP